MDHRALEELQAVCRGWSSAVKGAADGDGRIAFFRTELPKLLSRPALFEGVLKGILTGHPCPNLRQETLFDNELVLYRDAGRLFSLRLYFFGPGEHTFVHDHVSWGVSGPAFGPIEVIRYQSEEGDSEPRPARVRMSGRSVLRPGETETTLPLGRGIHRTGNPDDGTSVMASVYGPPLRRLFIQRFDLETGRVDRVYPPHVKKRMLVAQAVKMMAAAHPSN
jgi:predicted metal-dependent enzyme (double-stranded beta helix superfamily)